MARAYMLIFLACLLCNLAIAQDECYEVDGNNVGEEPKLALDLCAINDAVDGLDFDTAREIYEMGNNSQSLTLMEVATAEYPTDMYQKYAVFFGDQVWMHTKINQALNREGDFNTDVKQVQAVKKLLQASVLVQQFFYHLDSALAKITANNAAGALNSLDRAMAVYYGGDIQCSPFGNGQARGIEFGTVADGVSTTNTKVHAAIKEAGDALSVEDTSGAFEVLQDARTEIVKQVTVIYIQACFKYATLVDDGLEAEADVEKAQAEGYAYYQAIYPLIADVDPEGAAAIASAFNISKLADEDSVEEVKGIFRENYGKLSIGEEDVMDFDKDATANYEEPEETSCVLDNPFSSDDSGKPDVDR